MNGVDFASNFSLDVVYAKNNFTLPFYADAVYFNTTGHSCAFHNASYRASVSYSNGSQTTGTRIIDYGAQLGPIGAPEFEDLNGPGINQTTPEFLSAYSVMGLANAMSQYVYGTIGYSLDAVHNQPTLVPEHTDVLGSIFTAPTHFDEVSETTIMTLSLASTSYDNLGHLLEDACANLTASLMSDTANLGSFAQMPAIVIPDANIYRYQVWRLWVVYGIALAAALLADMYGLVCIFKNGGAMERTFSSIAASTRSHELDTLLDAPGEPLSARAQKTELRYRAARSAQSEGERAGFAIAQPDRDDVEMSEVVPPEDEGRP